MFKRKPYLSVCAGVLAVLFLPFALSPHALSLRVRYRPAL